MSDVDEGGSPRSETALRVRLGVVGVLGALFLGVTFRTDASHPTFYVATALLAASWFLGTALGRSFPVAPAPAGRSWTLVHLALPVGVGGACVAVFAVGALVVRQIPFLERNVVGVLERATAGSLWLVLLIAAVTAVAEELFFRGALYDAFRSWHPMIVTTAAYTVVTAASGNIMLVFAAISLGAVTAAVRHWTGGLVAPILVHLVWTSSMIVILPQLLPVSN